MLQAQIGGSTWVFSPAMGLGRVWGSWKCFFLVAKPHKRVTVPMGPPMSRRPDATMMGARRRADLVTFGLPLVETPGSSGLAPHCPRRSSGDRRGRAGFWGHRGGHRNGTEMPPLGAARGRRSSAARGRALGTAALGTCRLSTRWHQEPERCPQGTGSIWGAGWAALEPTAFVAGAGKEKRALKLLLVLHPIALCTTACSWGALQVTLPKPPQLPQHPTRSQTMSLADDSSVQILVLRTSSPLSPHTPWDPPRYHPLEAPRCPFYQLCGQNPKCAHLGEWDRHCFDLKAPLTGLHSGLGGPTFPKWSPCHRWGQGHGTKGPPSPCPDPAVLVPCLPLSPVTPTSGSAPNSPLPPIVGPHVSPGPTEIARTGGWAVGVSKNNNSDCAKKRKKAVFGGFFPTILIRSVHSPLGRGPTGARPPRDSEWPPPPSIPGPIPKGGAQIPPLLSPW